MIAKAVRSSWVSGKVNHGQKKECLILILFRNNRVIVQVIRLSGYCGLFVIRSHVLNKSIIFKPPTISNSRGANKQTSIHQSQPLNFFVDPQPQVLIGGLKPLFIPKINQITKLTNERPASYHRIHPSAGIILTDQRGQGPIFSLLVSAFSRFSVRIHLQIHRN